MCVTIKNKTVVDSFVNNEQYYILKATYLQTCQHVVATSQECGWAQVW